jgi:hypothetical protein
MSSAYHYLLIVYRNNIWWRNKLRRPSGKAGGGGGGVGGGGGGGGVGGAGAGGAAGVEGNIRSL